MWPGGKTHDGFSGRASDQQGDPGWKDPGFFNPVNQNFTTFASNGMSFGPCFPAFGSQPIMQPNQVVSNSEASSPLTGALHAGGHTETSHASSSQTVPARASSVNNSNLILDQRAAELKEMLLKNRKDRVNSTSPAHVGRNATNMFGPRNVQINNIMPRNTKLLRKNPPPSNQGAVDDIAELISSVRESASQGAGNEGKGGKLEDLALHQSAAKSPKTVRPAAGSLTSQQVTRSPPEAQSKSTGKEQVNGEKSITNQSPNATVADADSSIEEGEIVKETAPSTEKVDKVSGKPSGRAIPARPRPVNKSHNHKNNPNSSLVSRQEGHDNRQAPRGPLRMEEKKSVNKASDDGGKETPGSPDRRFPSLERLIEHDKDLRDWLLMTEYHDVGIRAKRLARFRQKQELDAKMQSLQLAMKKLEEDEEQEMKGKRQANVVVVVEQGQETAAHITTSKGKVGAATAGNTNILAAHARNGNPPAKREYEGDQGRVDRQDKMPRMGNGPDRNDAWQFARTDAQRGCRSLSRGADPSWQKFATHTPADHYSCIPYDRRPPSRGYSYGPVARGSSNYADGSPRGREVRVHQPSFIHLGEKGDSRFFIVKSFNEENVRRCMVDGVWTTQIDNGRVLADAFAECKNVILFFSVNKSRAFQGIARMETRPSPDIAKPRWMDAIHWETSPPFRVDWLSMTEVEFRRIGHLKNALNENSAVLVGKDGQEIEEECGRDLFHEMMLVAKERRGLTPSDGDDAWRRSRSPRPLAYRRGAGYIGRGTWGGGGGGRGRGGSFVKRETSRERDLP